MATAEDDDRRFSDRDIEATKLVRELTEAGLPEQGMLEVARVIGLATSQIAAASRSMVAGNFVQAGDNEFDAGMRLAAATENLTPVVGPLIEYSLRLHLREQLRRDVVSGAQLAEGGSSGGQTVAACFADLVGFTKLGESLPVDEIGEVSGRLGELVAEVVEPPVRLVKMIGDAAMLVSREPQALLEAGLDLIDLIDEQDDAFPLLRAGIAVGDGVPRGGDWFGRPVNMASRLAGAARPSSLLAAEGLRECVDHEAFKWSDAGRKELKGIGSVQTLRVRWNDDEADAEPASAEGSSRSKRRRRQRRSHPSE